MNTANPRPHAAPTAIAAEAKPPAAGPQRKDATAREDAGRPDWRTMTADRITARPKAGQPGLFGVGGQDDTHHGDDVYGLCPAGGGGLF